MKVYNLRQLREHLGLSGTEASHRLGVSQSRIVRMEAAEKSGKIAIGTLARAARALGYVLSYSYKPTTRSVVEQKKKGLKRSARRSTHRRESKLGVRMKEEVLSQSKSLTSEARLLQACELSDFVKELNQCTKKR